MTFLVWKKSYFRKLPNYFNKFIDTFKVKQIVKEQPKTAPVTEKIDALDLDDLDLTPQRSRLSNEASGGRSGAEIV